KPLCRAHQELARLYSNKSRTVNQSGQRMEWSRIRLGRLLRKTKPANSEASRNPDAGGTECSHETLSSRVCLTKSLNTRSGLNLQQSTRLGALSRHRRD